MYLFQQEDGEKDIQVLLELAALLVITIQKFFTAAVIY